MGGILSSNISEADLQMAVDKAKNLSSSSPVFIFSKTYCGYCNRVKKLFKQLGVTYKAFELNQESDGEAIQAGLHQWTGQRTVPNVFIGGKRIGGCDAMMEKHQQGQLVPLLIDAKAMPVGTHQTA